MFKSRPFFSRLSNSSFLAAIAIALVIPVPAQSGTKGVRPSSVDSARHSKELMTAIQNVGQEELRSSWPWDGSTIEVRSRGDIELTDDERDVKVISQSGYLIIEQKDRSVVSRSLEVVAGPNGELKRSFTLQGQVQEFDANAKGWLANILQEVIRYSGVGARARVQRILQRSGPDGVLDEISKIRTDGSKHIYFRELIKSHHLDNGALRKLVQHVAYEIASDGTKSAFLVGAADLYLNNDAVSPDFFVTIDTLKADGDRRHVLSSLLEKDLSSQNLLRTLKAAAGISSDGDKATLFITYADPYLRQGAVVPDFFASISAIKSNGDRRNIYLAFLEKNLNHEILLRVLRSAAGISSDGDKAAVLIRAAEILPNDDVLRSVILEISQTLSSDGDRRRVATALSQKWLTPTRKS